MKFQIFNVHGIRGRAETVMDLASREGVDIMVSMETWLADTDTIPIRQPSVVNITHTNYDPIAGGRRSRNGLLVNTTTPEYHHAARLLRTALTYNGLDYAAVIEVSGVTCIFAYLPPTSIPDSCIVDLVNLADELILNGATRVVAAGDFNARSEELTGDHDSSPRGHMLEEALEGSELRVQLPVAGKWTSITSGVGIPDMVMAYFPIADLVLHEHADCGGSDHRPLTFSVDADDPPPPPPSRWAVAKLQEDAKAAAFAQKVAEGNRMQGIADAMAEELAVAGPGELPEDAEQARIDRVWGEIVTVLHDAAASTIKRANVTPWTSDQFWTEDLVDARTELEEDSRERLQDILEGMPAQQARTRYRESKRKAENFRQMLRKRAKDRFHEAVDKLDHP